MSKITIALSVLTDNYNIKLIDEEIKLKQDIGKLLNEKGYEKFIIVDGEYIRDTLKNELEKDLDTKQLKQFFQQQMEKWEDKKEKAIAIIHTYGNGESNLCKEVLELLHEIKKRVEG